MDRIRCTWTLALAVFAVGVVTACGTGDHRSLDGDAPDAAAPHATGDVVPASSASADDRSGNVGPLDARIGHAMAAIGDKVVLFGGAGSGPMSSSGDETLDRNSDTVVDDTWEWSGSSWAKRDARVHPSARFLHGMATFASRGTVVLFGGVGHDGMLNDTWEWDGADWHERATKTHPRGLWRERAMAPIEDGVALVGDDGLWKWSGADWTTLGPAAPAGCPVAAMARLGAAGSTLVALCDFEGAGMLPPGASAAFWQWSPATAGQWVELPSGPPATVRGRLATLERGIVFVGTNLEAHDSQVWTFDGTWHRQSASPEVDRTQHALATVRSDGTDHVVLFGGNGDGRLNDTWTFDGVSWRSHEPDAPAALYGHAMATLGDEAVLFGGYPHRASDRVTPDFANEPAETWIWNGSAWRKAATTGPRPRLYASMTARGDRIVLFGLPSTAVAGDGETWEWDGHAWAELHPAPPLPPCSRSAGTVAPIASLGAETFLFPVDKTAQTWRWDGHAWTQLAPAVTPPARAGAAMATAGDRVILFGGRHFDDFVDYGDTWAWDGTSWRELHPKTMPPARDDHMMTSVGGHVFLYGGWLADRTRGFDDLWEWTGDDWVLRSAAVGTAPRGYGAMAAAAGHPLLFGGMGLRSVERLSDTWVFPGPTKSAAPDPH